jgi:hypothetical protein
VTESPNQLQISSEITDIPVVEKVKGITLLKEPRETRLDMLISSKEEKNLDELQCN